MTSKASGAILRPIYQVLLLVAESHNNIAKINNMDKVSNVARISNIYGSRSKSQQPARLRSNLSQN